MAATVAFVSTMGVLVHATHHQPRLVSAVVPATAYALPAKTTGPEHVLSELPVRLSIPTIHVDARVDPAGMTSGGLMVAPTGPATVTWLQSGPHPGDAGSAVMAGHYGRWRDGEGSVFDSLSQLKPGDSVVVQGDGGAITSFTVRALQHYAPSQAAPDVFNSTDGKAHLNLITCNGTWNKAQKTYSDRLIVFTDRVE